MAVVKLLRNEKSPIIPTDSSVFIGLFPSGGTAECRYKVSVSTDATNQTYPVDIVVSYTNREGTVVSSPRVTTGLPIKAKTAFSIVSPVPEVPAGSGRTIGVQYRNNGDVTAHNA